MIRSLPSDGRATFTFRRLGATQTTSAIYTGLETGAAAIPVVGPFVAAAARVAQALGIGYGCGGTCTQATQVVNQIEPVLKQNLAAAQAQAQANGGCLTPAEVATLTQNFNSLWNQVLQGCGQVPSPGGTQCIADRKPGGKYDWTSYYLTPIQQIPVCQTTAATISATPIEEGVNTAPETPAAAAIPAQLAAAPASTTLYLGLGALALFLLVKS